MKKKGKELKNKQAFSLSEKENYTRELIIQWYEYWEGEVYVSFSGGRDSTVLLYQVRKLFPDVPAVFIDTGLEYPEIRNFVKKIDNVEWIRPEIPFHEVIKKYGYPVISKMQAQYIDCYRNSGSQKMRDLRWNGKDYGYGQQYKISEKWKYLVDAPFKISDKCCDIIKKKPVKKYNKKSGKLPYLGMVAEESVQRKKQYLQAGCNAYASKEPKSNPMFIWLHSDVLGYIEKYNLDYAKIYDIYADTVRSTGCMFCLFGVHLDNSPNRFQLMKKNHPKQYNYCMNKLGLSQVLDFIGVDH